MTIDEYFGDWLKVIDKRVLSAIMDKLNIDYKYKSIYPNQKNVFKVFNLCSYNNLKVIMVGQDYVYNNTATGVLFGNNSTVKEDNLSESLKIIKEASINYEIPHNSINFDQSLESWCRQGILMLNTSLTYEQNKTHVVLWKPFMINLLKNLSKYNTGIVYVLFGKEANNFSYYINNRSNYVIKMESLLYYERNMKALTTLFRDINTKVKAITGDYIEWYEEFKC